MKETDFWRFCLDDVSGINAQLSYGGCNFGSLMSVGAQLVNADQASKEEAEFFV